MPVSLRFSVLERKLIPPWKLLTALAIVILLSTAFLNAEDSATKGKQVVDEAVAALGGARFLHMHTRVASGRIYAFFHDQLSGLDLATIYTEYLENVPPPSLAVQERELLGKKQDYSYLFLPDQGWDVTYRGARPVADESWDGYVRTTENDILYFLRHRYATESGLSYDFAGSEVYLSTHVEIVEITDSQGRTIRVYFDHNSKLPIRETFQWMNPDTRERNDEVIEYSKYRDAGGVMWPYSVERSKNGYKTYQMFADRVEVGGPLPPKIFELPPGSRTLKKVN